MLNGTAARHQSGYGQAPKRTQKIRFGLESEDGMFRLWAKEFKDNRMIRDMVVCNDDPSMTRTKKIFAAMDEICYAFDLSKPIWLDAAVEDFQRHNKTRFSQDHFIDSIEFDFLEIQVIEE